MAPIPTINDPSLAKQFKSPPTAFDVQSATESISSSLRVIVMILAALTLATSALYCLLRRRKRTKQLVIPATPLLVLESSVSINFDDLDDDQITVIEFEELSRRASFETVVSEGTPRELTFDFGKVMPYLERRRNDLLGRRGRATMWCDTTAFYESDVLPTTTTSPVDRRVSRPKVNLVEQVISPLSPFWSRQAAAAPSPIHRPVFGFDVKTITPPLGSPMWSRKGPLAGVTDEFTWRRGGLPLAAKT